jgi:hypothetical protein
VVRFRSNGAEQLFYPGGLALRFARVERYRSDTPPRRRTRSTTCARSSPPGVMPDLLYGPPGAKSEKGVASEGRRAHH